MAEHRVDGIILVCTPSTTAAHIPMLPPRVPLVMLDRRPPDFAAHSLISCDTVTATRDLCRHLFALGHQRIAIVGGMPAVPTWSNRLVGYRQAQREAGRAEAEDLVFPGNYYADSGASITRNLMASIQPPDVIIAASTLVLYGVLDELAAEGTSIPADIAVCCVDDPALPEFFRPRFTHVEQPGYAMGAAAVETVLAELRSGAPRGDREFPATLHIGESCGERDRGVLASDPVVSAARH
jgi:LacI family transcriptional regulator